MQTTPKGDSIAFLSRDKEGHINIFAVSPNGGVIKQLSFHCFDIQTGFNFSPDGRYVAYGAENAVHITAVASGESHQVTENFSDDEAPAGPVSWSPDGKTLAYNRYVGRDGQRFLQVFLLKET
ncbi:MAG: hypothetical protein EOO88_36950 [Pedobacter sp.]|nr:MAG: hypothetical protein EOO88_36950 [Pedobacter sp.]